MPSGFRMSSRPLQRCWVPRPPVSCLCRCPIKLTMGRLAICSIRRLPPRPLHLNAVRIDQKPWRALRHGFFLLKKLLFSSFYLRHTIGRMAKSTNLFLVGLMGAGKSTIGRQLAKSLDCEIIDSDHEIEARTGANIPLIFDVEGEAGFRQREKKIIDDLTQREHIVLATGGGVVLDPENRAHLHEFL